MSYHISNPGFQTFQIGITPHTAVGAMENYNRIEHLYQIVQYIVVVILNEEHVMQLFILFVMLTIQICKWISGKQRFKTSLSIKDNSWHGNNFLKERNVDANGNERCQASNFSSCDWCTPLRKSDFCLSCIWVTIFLTLVSIKNYVKRSCAPEELFKSLCPRGNKTSSLVCLNQSVITKSKYNRSWTHYFM